MALFPRLPRPVKVLGLASLLTDLSSEMIYPLLPAFLSGVLGAGAAALGLVEGVAEATASLLKAAGGWWSDRMGRRKPLVVLGYGVSGACRPLIGLATAWTGVLLLRFGDRVGKGVRTAPRDALIAEATDPSARGAAFGFHSAMDHGGAILGPLAAAALLALGVGLRSVFLLAAIPALFVMAVLLLGIREKAPPPRVSDPSRDGVPLPPSLKRLIAAAALFTLGNSADAFLLLRLSDAGLAPQAVALLWSAHHGVKMAATYFFGSLCDRFGRRRFLASGWLWYAGIYAGFALIESPTALVVLFLLYGLYFGLAEPAERAWTADLAPASARGRAFGWFHGTTGLMALPASALFGLLWQTAGAATAFGAGAALALAASFLLLGVPERAPGDGDRSGCAG